MKRTTTSALLCASLLCAAATVQAQSTGTGSTTSYGPTAGSSFLPGTTRGYVGINVGQARYRDSCVAGFSCERDDTGFKVYTGGRINDMLSVELGYVDFGRVSRNGGSTDAKGVNLSLVGTLPFNELFSVFGKVGTTYGWTSQSVTAPGVSAGDEHNFALAYGVGAGYNLTANVQLVGEWEQHRLDFRSGRENISMYSLGLRYKF